ncbi:rab3 GTPase-activating protein non-catalytic subunit-like isoform X2 [Oscarella lobularis]|uniref:rab3 GTPase-activating protein non-catalytic subunit-like isoform X2 n=1 Tax=Oscarella lobularis TaxID=121494 RepID=UPI0033138A2A
MDRSAVEIVPRCVIDVSTQREANQEREIAFPPSHLASISPKGSLLASFDIKNRLSLTKIGENETKTWTEEIDYEATCIETLELAVLDDKTSKNRPKTWTCVAIGFRDGSVRFYDENGRLLLSQTMHEGVVVKLKGRGHTGMSQAKGGSDSESLLILYRSALVSVEGLHLVQMLHVCKRQTSQATHASPDVADYLRLTYKKWDLEKHDKVNDIDSCGMATDSLYDYLKDASTLGGYNTTVRSTPAASHRFIAVGVNPMIGLYKASHDLGEPQLADVAVAVASKLKSVVMSRLPISTVTGWLWGSSSSASADPKSSKSVEEKANRTTPSTPIPLAVGLSDPRRTVTTIHLSPCWTLALTVDEFGRVMLLDVNQFTLVRIWKGYREAQCGFCTSREDSDDPRSHVGRLATFVVIYAPRRGIVEVWPVNRAERVAAFNVGKKCRLLYQGQGVVGVQKGLYPCQCVLLQPDGSLNAFRIPFYCTMSGSDRALLADKHTLNQFKQALAKADVSLLCQLAREIISLECLKKAVASLETSSLASTDLLSAFMSVRDGALSLAAGKTFSGERDDGFSALSTVCEFRMGLIGLYVKVSASSSLAKSSERSDEDLSEFYVLAFGLTSHRAVEICALLSTYAELELRQFVATSADSIVGLVDFLKYFEISDEGEEELGFRGLVSSKANKAILGLFLFKPALEGSVSLDDLLSALEECHISADDSMNLLICASLSGRLFDHDDAESLERLVELIKRLSSYQEKMIPGEDSLSSSTSWWRPWHDKIQSSSRLYESLLVSLSCANVAKSDQTEDEDDWEALSIDIELWDVLVRRLEDLVALACLIGRPSGEDTLSVARLLNANVADVFARLVARRLVARRFDARVVDAETSTTTAEDEPELAPDRLTSDERRFRFELDSLRGRFPYTLRGDSLHVYAAWEAVNAWKMNSDDTELLDVALGHLTAFESLLLRIGLSVVLWNEIFLKIVSELLALIEKVGKSPKDRLSRKFVKLSSDALPSVLKVVQSVLLDLRNSSLDMIENEGDIPTPIFRGESLWHPDSSIEDEGLWRKVLAAGGKPCNANRVSIHYHLVTVLHAIVALQLKSVRPSTLFDPKISEMFFTDLTSDSPDVDLADPGTNRLNEIEKFLSLIVVASCDFPAVGNAWPDVAVELAADAFRVDPDVARRHHVVELYTRRRDAHAREVRGSVRRSRSHCVGSRFAARSRSTFSRGDEKRDE